MDLGNDLRVYVSEPTTSSPLAAVLVLPEVFGWSGRLKGIADTLAQEGYLAVMPDCHRGDTAAGKPDIPKVSDADGPVLESLSLTMPGQSIYGIKCTAPHLTPHPHPHPPALLQWVAETPWDPTVKGDFTLLMDFIKSKNLEKVCAIGFCWGAWAWAKAASSGFSFSCCVGAHPSIKLEEFAFGGSIMEMVEAVPCPCLLLAGGNDPDNVKPGGEYAKVFEEKGGKAIAFEDQLHGWVSRGDITDENIKKGVDTAMEEALAFFKANL